MVLQFSVIQITKLDTTYISRNVYHLFYTKMPYHFVHVFDA